MKLEWENIKSDDGDLHKRAKVFGGWLIKTIVHTDNFSYSPMGCGDGYTFEQYQFPEYRASIAFVPDPSHEWE